ncbi:hypothetical protein V1264_010336 [Littorina saxatilis]|uniref:Pre-rRNA-processing protein RIX1 N-terminal domain-containing protein n=1 Tax=Littorina saxatilis TaxID=31220 RepID=A0AAN9G0L3_9CAEN
MAHYIDNVLSFAKPLISGDSKQNSRHFENLIKATAEHGLAALKDPDVLNGVVAEINSCLNSSQKRLEGLSALKPVAISCSDQVFSNNCQTWFQLLLQALQSYGSPRQHQLTLQLLTVIIQRVTAFPELDREFGTAKIKTLLPTLLLLCSKSTEEAVSSLHCIMACIKFFPGPTSLFKTKIEAVLVEGLDSASPPQVYTRCYAALARCSTGGHRGDKHREGWSTLYDKLIATLNYTLSQLYQGFETGL